MWYIANKKLISGFMGIVVLFAAFWFISPYIKQASADARLTADAHVIDGYLDGCWYCPIPKAPTTMQILIHGGGNFDGATRLSWDCDNDGVYEGSGSGTPSGTINPGDGTVMVEWWNGNQYRQHSWNVYWGEMEYWYEFRTSCSYPTGGQKTIGVKAERGGMTATGGTSFYIQDLVFNFSVDIPANGDYLPPLDDPSRGLFNAGTPAPTNVDLGIGMREEGCNKCYQDDGSYRAFDTRGFTYTVDCNGDGNFDERSGSSNDSSFYIFPGYPPTWTHATFADNVCHFDKPGAYTIAIKIKDPTGKERTVNKEVYVRSSEPVKVNVYPASESPGETSYAFSGPQNVNLSFNITGLVPISTGSYGITVECGNGQTVSGPSANGRNYPEGVLQADNAATCNYSSPGVYEVKAKFQENKPASEQFPAKSGEGKTKIIITGESGGVWTVVSPFSLEWDVSRADSCSITGLNDSFSAAGLTATGTKAVPKVPIGTYNYRLSCSGPGGSNEQTIKINVVDEL